MTPEWGCFSPAEQSFQREPSSVPSCGPGMLDSSVADQLTRLTLKLLKKKLEQEREDVEGASEDPHVVPGDEDGPETALRSALRMRKDLLQRLWEQRLLEEASRVHHHRGVHGGAQGSVLPPEAPPVSIHPTVSPAPPALDPPRIIQHPVTSPPCPSHTEVVEMMLMQNAQAHQLLTQALMLRALPPPALAPTPPHLTPQAGSTPRPRPEDLVASPPGTHVFLAPGLCFLPNAPGAPQGNPRGGQVVPARPRQLPPELRELCGSLVRRCPPLLTLTSS
ncbi:PREDICTED: uncharacterized protein C21orf58 homolog [Bison bison bison]|uniref:Uncharacterized protein C21orf58 homolog n=1 Tax=Bison bison bison TaxID=43346 RepID=A0A6P3H2E7_BISBB|nr:PREDICTED: uncharacterized protein C21orf58 homolog [Bison bison bison]